MVRLVRISETKYRFFVGDHQIDLTTTNDHRVVADWVKQINSAASSRTTAEIGSDSDSGIGMPDLPKWPESPTANSSTTIAGSAVISDASSTIAAVSGSSSTFAASAASSRAVASRSAVEIGSDSGNGMPNLPKWPESPIANSTTTIACSAIISGTTSTIAASSLPITSSNAFSRSSSTFAASAASRRAPAARSAAEIGSDSGIGMPNLPKWPGIPINKSAVISGSSSTSAASAVSGSSSTFSASFNTISGSSAASDAAALVVGVALGLDRNNFIGGICLCSPSTAIVCTLPADWSQHKHYLRCFESMFMRYTNVLPVVHGGYVINPHFEDLDIPDVYDFALRLSEGGIDNNLDRMAGQLLGKPFGEMMVAGRLPRHNNQTSGENWIHNAMMDSFICYSVGRLYHITVAADQGKKGKKRKKRGG